MARVNLTETRIRALQPDPTGRQRRELRDALVPGLIVRCAARRKIFALHTRFPGAKAPTRRAIGEVGTLTLSDARSVARQWLELVRRGVDPAADAPIRRIQPDAAAPASAAPPTWSASSITCSFPPGASGRSTTSPAATSCGW